MYTPEQAYELAMLTLVIWREARGEPDDAKHAVAWVIRNRVEGKAWFGQTWCGVILKPKQFSSFNAGDPNSTKIPEPSTDPSFGSCLLAAKHVYDGTSPDLTFGSTYYHDTSIQPPNWTAELTKTVEIGKLVFYKIQ